MKKLLTRRHEAHKVTDIQEEKISATDQHGWARILKIFEAFIRVYPCSSVVKCFMVPVFPCVLCGPGRLRRCQRQVNFV
jgi:hypothetical protein